ncbi:MAG TPA: condensation domain-containing protein, partial [Tahibacter sp.]|nr:condensation domain-containing protein [Tahibacter sp.]
MASRIAVEEEAQGADLGAEAQERVLPLAAAQRRIWFVSRLGPAQSAAYNLAMGMRLRGPLDPARLQQALDLLCLRHDALRCRIVENDGVPQLHVSAAGRRFRLQCRDLSADPAPDATLDELIADQARTPFDLAA